MSRFPLFRIVEFMSGDENENRNSKRKPTYGGWGGGIAIGVAIGVSLGVAMDNLGAGIAIGIGIGVAFGSAFDAAEKRRRNSGGGRANDSDETPSR